LRGPLDDLSRFEINFKMWEGPGRDRKPLEMTKDITGYHDCFGSVGFGSVRRKAVPFGSTEKRFPCPNGSVRFRFRFQRFRKKYEKQENIIFLPKFAKILMFRKNYEKQKNIKILPKFAKILMGRCWAFRGAPDFKYR